MLDVFPVIQAQIPMSTEILPWQAVEQDTHCLCTHAFRRNHYTSLNLQAASTIRTSISDIKDEHLLEQYCHPAPGLSQDSPVDYDIDLW